MKVLKNGLFTILWLALLGGGLYLLNLNAIEQFSSEDLHDLGAVVNAFVPKNAIVIGGLFLVSAIMLLIRKAKTGWAGFFFDMSSDTFEDVLTYSFYGGAVATIVSSFLLEILYFDKYYHQESNMLLKSNDLVVVFLFYIGLALVAFSLLGSLLKGDHFIASVMQCNVKLFTLFIVVGLFSALVALRYANDTLVGLVNLLTTVFTLLMYGTIVMIVAYIGWHILNFFGFIDSNTSYSPSSPSKKEDVIDFKPNPFHAPVEVSLEGDHFQVFTVYKAISGEYFLYNREGSDIHVRFLDESRCIDDSGRYYLA